MDRGVVGSQNGRLPGAVGAQSRRAGPKSKKIGVRHGVLGPGALGVRKAGSVEIAVRSGISLRTGAGGAGRLGPRRGGLSFCHSVTVCREADFGAILLDFRACGAP